MYLLKSGDLEYNPSAQKSVNLIQYWFKIESKVLFFGCWLNSFSKFIVNRFAV